ncbi:MAG: polyamine aminopropyltransferase [Bauldia litoralis]
MTAWFDESLHDGIRQSIRVDEVLHHERTEHQDLIIFRSNRFGRVLGLDGGVQTTEFDEFVYHEMLAHPPILARQAATGAVDNVLIVGGGDGGALREVLRHPGVRATMVEIDRSVIDLSREYLPRHSDGAFDDPRATIVIADGAKFVEETDDRFDVVIIDSTDPIGPGEVLFTEQFYAGCKRCLKPGGVLVTQNGVPALQDGELKTSYRNFRNLFADAAFYLCVVPTYFGGFMALGWATDDAGLRKTPVDKIAAGYDAAGLSTRYFTPALFAGAFTLPAFIPPLLTD